MTNDPGSGAVVASGPFSLRGALVLLLLGPGLGACASAQPDQGPEEPRPVTERAEEPGSAAEAAEAGRILSRVESLRSTRPSRAAALADSVYFRWREAPGLRTEALRALLLEARALAVAGEPVEAAARLRELLAANPPEELASAAAERAASLHIELGLEPAAVRALLAHGGGLSEERRLDLLERAASGMSISELEDLLADRRSPAGTAETVLLRAELARALALTGRSAAAREAVRGVSVEEAPRAVTELVRRIREGRLDGTDGPPVRVEAVLPLSGSLAPVGRFLRQGMELAVEEYRAAGGDSVRVSFRDDRSRSARSRRLIRSAETAGAAAVVGPARSAALAAAMGARRDPALPVLSPTASSPPREGWNGYSLWGLESRERTLARAVSRWLVESAGIDRLAVLRPRGGVGRVAEQAFRAGAGRWGGGVLAAASYLPDSTTFESEIRRLAGIDPEAVFVASRDPRNALQIAPQLSYYGLGTSAVAGGSAWGEPAVVRRLRGGSPSLYVTAVFTDRGAGTAWADFKAMYEMKYDRPLSDNILPALGYDAMKVILTAVDSVGLPRRGAIARSLASGSVQGATGRLRFRLGHPAAGREPRVRLGVDGNLEAADPERLRTWIRRAQERQQARERQRRDRAAERVRRWSAGAEGGRP